VRGCDSRKWAGVEEGVAGEAKDRIPQAKGPTKEDGMVKLLKSFWHEDSGQGLVEYALILFLVALVVILALRILGGRTANVLNNVADSLQTTGS
jgi:pilus assembly protein Flp/PilA